VPFFLSGGTAVAIGRGTEYYGLPDVAAEPALVVASGIHVATAAAYQALGRGLTSPDFSRKINDFRLFVRTLGDLRSARAASTLSANDFESAVFSQQPLLKKIWSRLRKHSAGARMTGSGSALFAVYGSKAERDLAAKTLEGDRVFEDCRVIPASLVTGTSYRQLWRRQLAEHIEQTRSEKELIWPPHSRHAA
jgi:4-diphosphocytidyl-2-C-methyl-D-erythritol kinase